MWRLRRDGRSKALPQTWHGSKGRWRAGRPLAAADEFLPAFTPMADATALTLWWWARRRASDEASSPEVLAPSSSRSPDESTVDCSLETDWRPSEAPPEAIPCDVAPSRCCCCCIGGGGGGDKGDPLDDVNNERDRSSGLS